MNLDDGWMATARTSGGALTWNTSRFPDGIPWLASQVHALGLKFGIYEAIGTRTCQNLPGSGGTTAAASHYAQDAATFAAWQRRLREDRRVRRPAVRHHPELADHRVRAVRRGPAG